MKKHSTNINKNKNKLSVGWKIFFLISLVFGTLLFFSWITSFIQPVQISFIASLSLLFFHLYIVSFIIFLIWLVKKPLHSLIYFSLLILMFPTFRFYLPIRVVTIKENSVNSSQLKCLTYNVRSFNAFYNHESQEYLNDLSLFLNNLNPDLICFQEYYNDKKYGKSITRYLMEYTNLKYVYFYPRLIRYNRYEFGLAIFSRNPIISSGMIENVNYPDEEYSTNYVIYADINLLNDTIRIYNIHLESFKISEENQFIDLVHDNNFEKFIKKIKSIFCKLSTAYEFRARQLEVILDHIRKSPHPVIIMGDLNDVPSSWTYRQLIKFGVDTHIAAGKGLGNTYISPYLSTRIDYIFVDTTFRVIESKAIKSNYSDHYPVYAVILKKNE